MPQWGGQQLGRRFGLVPLLLLDGLVDNFVPPSAPLLLLGRSRGAAFVSGPEALELLLELPDGMIVHPTGESPVWVALVGVMSQRRRLRCSGGGDDAAALAGAEAGAGAGGRARAGAGGGASGGAEGRASARAGARVGATAGAGSRSGTKFRMAVRCSRAPKLSSIFEALKTLLRGSAPPRKAKLASCSTRRWCSSSSMRPAPTAKAPAWSSTPQGAFAACFAHAIAASVAVLYSATALGYMTRNSVGANGTSP